MVEEKRRIKDSSEGVKALDHIVQPMYLRTWYLLVRELNEHGMPRYIHEVVEIVNDIGDLRVLENLYTYSDAVDMALSELRRQYEGSRDIAIHQITLEPEQDIRMQPDIGGYWDHKQTMYRKIKASRYLSRHAV